jgi:hypothetical protein
LIEYFQRGAGRSPFLSLSGFRGGFDAVLLGVLYELVFLYVEVTKVIVVASGKDLAGDPADDIGVNAVPFGQC